jgi:hypothetical protein
MKFYVVQLLRSWGPREVSICIVLTCMFLHGRVYLELFLSAISIIYNSIRLISYRVY